MIDSLLVVFSNFNGNRTINDVTIPRIKLMIDSFIDTCGNSSNTHGLLLDNGSTDGSEDILKSYESGYWKYMRKTTEDYYLGTLYKLLHQFSDEYKYMMVIDNDQFFFRKGCLERAVQIMDDNDDIICVHLKEHTKHEDEDKHPGKKCIAGVYDRIEKTNGSYWGRAARFSGKEKFFKRTSDNKGMGFVSAKGFSSKRVCWYHYGFSNVIIRTKPFIEIFKRKGLELPYKSNPDRLALFSSTVARHGESAHLLEGASINFGFRNHISPEISVMEMIENYRDGDVKSLNMSDNYAFYYNEGKLGSIEKAIGSLNE